ncbi:MAG: hypothetical protein CL843_12175 [Crocinitomicaceae bacterium]|nr:hypothetical protein [Crocinitomicaceae bacterium]|tara:strand:+ start:495 stop:989 length:495 start_codon:yes stop_codon:yes gene_type:complete
METQRTRTYTWDDPLVALEKAKALTGLEYIKQMHAGKIAPPPILDTAGISMFSVKEGDVVFLIHPQEFQYNPIGSVHGGIITTILDSAIGCSLHTVLEKNTAYTTLEIKVNFMRKITHKTPPLHTETTIIHRGRSTALLESKLIDSDQSIYAYASSTCMIFNLS